MGSSPSAPAKPKKGKGPITLALHLGAHKTATTHLQATLRKNSEIIEDEGIRYYGPLTLRRPGMSVRHLFGLCAPIKGTPKRTPTEQLEFMAKSGSRVVLSEENFWGTVHDLEGKLTTPLYPLALPRLQGLAAAIAPNRLQVYLCVREPSSFLASGHGQALLGDHRVTLDEFLGGVTPFDLKWSELLSRITEVPGIDTIYLWTYEQYRTMAPLIYRRLLKWRIGPKITFYDGKVHPGLSARAVEAALDPEQSGEGPEFAHRARSAFPVGKTWPRYAPFSPEVVDASRKAYLKDLLTIDKMEGVTFLRPQLKVKDKAKPKA